MDVSSVSPIPVSALNILGISNQDRQYISEFLDNMNFGNSQNIIGLSTLYSDPSDGGVNRTFKKFEKRQNSDLPPLIDLDMLSKDEKDLLM